MRCVLGLAALAGFAGTGMAQSMYLSASNVWPADGEVVTIDVVLDATPYSGEFFAWHSFGFNIEMASAGVYSGLGAQIGGVLDESNIAETADTTGVPATLSPWTGGRRPGAFPGSASNNGGSRFGPQLADVVTDSFIGSSFGDGTISGRQQSASAPENNALINQSRVYEAFRFQFTYTSDLRMVCFTLANVSASVYTNPAGDEVFVQDQMSIGGVCIPPIPTSGTAFVVGAVGFGTVRRRW